MVNQGIADLELILPSIESRYLNCRVMRNRNPASEVMLPPKKSASIGRQPTDGDALYRS
jgi:hypothetical protein